MGERTEMEISVSGGRIIDAKVMPNGRGKLTVDVESDAASLLVLMNKNLVVPKKKIILQSVGIERIIDPLSIPIDAEWMQYEPKTRKQRELKELFLEARAKERLHIFSCMAMDASIEEKKLIYAKGLNPACVERYSVGRQLEMIDNYAPNRNSRWMTKTEYVCKCLVIIGKLVEEGWKIEKAWYAVCDDSRELGHYTNSDNSIWGFEPTGSRKVCDFYDLANTCKMLARDPWEEGNHFWSASGYYCKHSDYNPIASFRIVITMLTKIGRASCRERE